MKSHDGVYTRLAASQIHGIGVFAILPIPKGTALFTSEGSGLVSGIPDAEVQSLPAPLKKLYTDFAIQMEKGGEWVGPLCFDDMSTGWYVNHSKTPNINISKEYYYTALRDILVGEELTVDYDTYSPMVTE
jgi:SET domain-containing protein